LYIDLSGDLHVVAGVKARDPARTTNAFEIETGATSL
jgi:hypothetical protein